MHNEHTLLLIVGRTASGKDSLVNKLCERTGMKQIISYTTRERRVNEGETHHFVTEEDYQQMYEDDTIAAFTQIGQHKYWSTIDQLYENDIYIIDYNGIKTLRELDLPDLRLVTVFINVPDEIREKRALEYRQDDKNKFRSRNFAESSQFREMLRNADFDYSVNNLDFSKAYSVIKWVCDVEGLWKNHSEDTTK